MRRFVRHLRSRSDPFLLLILALIVVSSLREEGANRWVPLAFAVAIVAFVLLPDGRPSKFKSYALMVAMAVAYLGAIVYTGWYAWGAELTAWNILLGAVFAGLWAYMGVTLWQAMVASHRLAQTGVYDRYKRPQTPSA